MSELHNQFVASIERSSLNATIIFGIALGSVLAYLALNLLPESWRSFAKLAAWVYAVVIIGATVAMSAGG